jgi:hypothetical protein
MVESKIDKKEQELVYMMVNSNDDSIPHDSDKLSED